MKQIALLISIALIATTIIAQPIKNRLQTPGGGQRAETVIVGYVTKKLNLTVEEAQQFWPVYNNFTSELRASATANNGDEIKKTETMLAVQKKYKPEFSKVLKSDERANQVFIITRNLQTMAERRKQEARGENSERRPMQERKKNKL